MGSDPRFYLVSFCSFFFASVKVRVELVRRENSGTRGSFLHETIAVCILLFLSEFRNREHKAVDFIHPSALSRRNIASVVWLGDSSAQLLKCFINDSMRRWVSIINNQTSNIEHRHRTSNIEHRKRTMYRDRAGALKGTWKPNSFGVPGTSAKTNQHMPEIKSL